MEVTPLAFQEIRQKLEAAGYHQALHADDERDPPLVLDMHGIAVASLAMEDPPHTGDDPIVDAVSAVRVALEGIVEAKCCEEVCCDQGNWQDDAADALDQLNVVDRFVLAARGFRPVVQPPEDAPAMLPWSSWDAAARATFLEEAATQLLRDLSAGPAEHPEEFDRILIKNHLIAAIGTVVNITALARLQRAANAGYALSTYAASIRTDGSPNEPEWLEHLLDQVEQTQEAARAAGVTVPPGTMFGARPTVKGAGDGIR
jgi:hypothetical protein